MNTKFFYFTGSYNLIREFMDKITHVISLDNSYSNIGRLIMGDLDTQFIGCGFNHYNPNDFMFKSEIISMNGYHEHKHFNITEAAVGAIEEDEDSTTFIVYNKNMEKILISVKIPRTKDSVQNSSKITL